MAQFTVHDLLSSYPPLVVSTVEKLRQLIHQIAPEVKEKANRGWRSISYRDTHVGYFCGIFPFEEHVDLIFEFGALLNDPHGVLQGDAKQTRSLRFHEAGDIDNESVKQFIQDALGLPASHSVRLGLTQNKLTLGPGEN